ncbi:MAG: hypothetical protein IJB57_00890 [Clostridia bacterium]|nr:hypothetical protein [Clostridia bacterium]
MNTWDNILSNWEYVLPPSRPSRNELDRISEIINKYNRNEPVAVLGSTVEFRDLLYEMHFTNVYIFEKNMSFYKSLDSWKIYPNTNETVIVGDWIDKIHIYKNLFNVCLSDLTMGNVAYEHRDVFYHSISNSLKKEGVFIDKVLTNELPLLTINELKTKYNTLPINLRTVNDFSCEALFCSELLNVGIIDTTRFYNCLKKSFANEKRLIKYIEKSHLITPENCIWYYGQPWNEVSKPYLKHLVIIDCFEDEIRSPYYGRLKIYICHNKQGE